MDHGRCFLVKGFSSADEKRSHYDPRPSSMVYGPWSEAVQKRQAMIQMNDPFMKLLGLQASTDAPGTARVRGRVRPEHLNMHGMAHGGFLYTLADIAFALAA